MSEMIKIEIPTQRRYLEALKAFADALALPVTNTGTPKVYPVQGTYEGEEKEMPTGTPSFRDVVVINADEDKRKLDSAFEGEIDGSSKQPPLPPVFDDVPLPPKPADTVEELDALGLPWDKDIHSSNHKRYDKKIGSDERKVPGAWQVRAGLAMPTWNRVVAKLRETYPDPNALTIEEPALPAPPPPPTLPGTDEPMYSDLQQVIVDGYTAVPPKFSAQDVLGFCKSYGLDKPSDASDPARHDAMVKLYKFIKGL